MIIAAVFAKLGLSMRLGNYVIIIAFRPGGHAREARN